MSVIEKIEKMNFENIIMDKLFWTIEQKNFYGTLIYSIEDINGDDIANVICKRTKDNISVKHIYPTENNDNSIEHSLIYDKNKKDIDYLKSSENIKNFQEGKLFLDFLSNIINEIKPVFYPIENIKDNKNNVEKGI